MTTFVRCVLLVVTLCGTTLVAAAQETRVALVIGNGAYANVQGLTNPVRDAVAVAQALRGAGFQEVQVETDLGHDAMLKALRRFEDAASKADWALVYFAGHGIEIGGVNYLVPVDARLRSDRDVDEEAVSLAQVQKRLEGARKLRLVVLDACRNNPFLASMQRTQGSTRSVGRGLAVPELPQSGSLVAFSAAAGQEAVDGETAAGNSPYAAALIKNLALPDVEVNLFFRRVRVAVLRATGNQQEPATYESLPDDRLVVRVPPTGAAIASVAPAKQPDPSFTLPALATPREAFERSIRTTPEYAAWFEKVRSTFPNEYDALLDDLAKDGARDGKVDVDLAMTKAVAAIRHKHGTLATHASGAALSQIFRMQLKEMRALAARDPQLCVAFLNGAGADGFQSFAAEHRGLVAEAAIAGLDAITDGQAQALTREPPNDVDFQSLDRALVKKGLTRPEIDALLDGKTPTPPIDDKAMCDAGMKYLETLALLPAETRSRLYVLAVGLMAKN